jgi:hypothetical protein
MSDGAVVSAQQCNSIRTCKTIFTLAVLRVLDNLERFATISTKSTRLDMVGLLLMGTYEKSCL